MLICNAFNSTITYRIMGWGGAYNNHWDILKIVQTRILMVVSTKTS